MRRSHLIMQATEMLGVLFLVNAVLLPLVVEQTHASPESPLVTVRLADFESQLELDRWEVAPTLTPMQWTLDDEHVRRGKHSAKLITPSVKEGGVSKDETYKGRGWPAVVLPAEQMPTADWTSYRHIAFEAYNPGSATVPVWVRFGDHHKFEKVSLRSGWQTVRLNIDHISTLDELRFFFADPVYTSTIHLDDVRLEVGDVDDLREVADRASEYISGAEEHPRTRHVRHNLRDIRVEIDGLAERWLEIVAGEDAEEIARWVGQVQRLKKRLERFVPRAQADRFAVDLGDRRWGYGWISGLTKVLRDSERLPFPGELGGTVKVALAANEAEGVQLVLRFTSPPAARPLQNVRVTVTDLTGPSGSRITADQIEVLPVGYVNPPEPPYHVEHLGWWPDPLLDFLDGFELDPNVWQPVWLDVRTTADQAPGLYRGEIAVTADGDVAPFQVPIEVEVWDFAVPVEHHFPVSLTYGPEFMGAFYFTDHAELQRLLKFLVGEIDEEELGTGEARRMYDVDRRNVELMLDHRMFPDSIFRHRGPPSLDEAERWRERGVRRFIVLAIQQGFQGTLEHGSPYPAADKKRMLDTLAVALPRFEAAGMKDMLHIFGFDEVGENTHAAMKDIYGEVKERWPWLPLMTTAYDRSYGLDSGLDEYVDAWIPSVNAYAQSTAAIDAARARGRKIWWYIHSGPDDPYPNFLIEDTPSESRLLMGFIAHKSGSDGFLYWYVSQWQETVTRGPLTNARGRGAGSYNGSGVIFYPGPDGPVSTIRMKAIRDGLEDYEYLWLLKQAVEKARGDVVGSGERQVPDDWLTRAEAALAIDDALVVSVADYSKNPEDLLTARRQIAELLVQARAGGSAEKRNPTDP